MKILKTTDTSLKVIPRRFPSEVDLIIRNERTNETTTESGISVTSSGGYLDIPFTYTFEEENNYDFEVHTPTQDAGVKCIAANNEYLSSPAGNYFGDTLTGLDIEIDYEAAVNFSFLFNQGFFNAYLRVQRNANTLNLLVKGDLGGVQGFLFDFGQDTSTGKVRFVENSGSIDAYFNDSYHSSIVITIGLDIATAQSDVLYFNTLNGAASYDCTYKSIRIGTKIWDNWTSPTTTNNEGDVTTLHSDVSTSAMIIEDSQGERIYKGKIFCTNQDDYSINNNRYKERNVERTYTYR